MRDSIVEYEFLRDEKRSQEVLRHGGRSFFRLLSSLLRVSGAVFAIKKVEAVCTVQRLLLFDGRIYPRVTLSDVQTHKKLHFDKSGH